MNPYRRLVDLKAYSAPLEDYTVFREEHMYPREYRVKELPERD